MRVLVVEDSRTQAESLRDDLEGAGFGVDVAGDGVEALARLRDQHFDVVVSDIVMPGMDGYDLCRRLKEDPGSRDIPVVLLTSLSDPLDVVHALETGADNFIRKPYESDQLIARVYAAGHSRRLREAGGARMGVQLSFMDRVFDITADRQQILDLLISTFEDLVVTSRQMRQRESQLAEANGRLRAVLDSVPVPLFVVAEDASVCEISEASANAFGVAAAKLLDRPLDAVIRFVGKDGLPVSPDALPHRQALEQGRSASAGTAFDLFIDGAGEFPVPVVLHASPILNAQGRPAGSVCTAQLLQGLMDHDPLTGLPSAAAFVNATVRGIPTSGTSAVLLLEVDRFDVTRVSHGGNASNAALVEASERLTRLFDAASEGEPSSECSLAFLGGCQFGVVLSSLPDSLSVLHLAEAARRQLSGVEVADATVRITASVGVAIADSSHPWPELVAAASTALQRARQSGGDRVEVFGHAASQDAIDRLHLEIDLRTALDGGEIELHYQPEVDLSTGRILGFEALARWRHERLGPVAPTRFISVAEDSGLIVPLGRRILAEACRQASLWQQTYDASLTIAVNVSAKQLRVEFVHEVIQTLEETGITPSSLTLELTETAAMSEPERSLPILRELAGLGVRLALDDFGTGYSSMAYLTQIRFDQLKLDRGFVNRVTEGGTDAVVAQSIIALGHALGVPVLAEGIEQPEQAATLLRFGCDQGQGYLFGKPVNPASIQELLDRSRDQRFTLPH